MQRLSSSLHVLAVYPECITAIHVIGLAISVITVTSLLKRTYLLSLAIVSILIAVTAMQSSFLLGTILIAG